MLSHPANHNSLGYNRVLCISNNTLLRNKVFDLLLSAFLLGISILFYISMSPFGTASFSIDMVLTQYLDLNDLKTDNSSETVVLININTPISDIIEIVDLPQELVKNITKVTSYEKASTAFSICNSKLSLMTDTSDIQKFNATYNYLNQHTLKVQPLNKVSLDTMTLPNSHPALEPVPDQKVRFHINENSFLTILDDMSVNDIFEKAVSFRTPAPLPESTLDRFLQQQCAVAENATDTLFAEETLGETYQQFSKIDCDQSTTTKGY